jgi:hypothetical protein
MCVDAAIGLNVDDLCGPTDSTLSLSVSVCALGRPGPEVWLVISPHSYSYRHCHSDLSAIKVPEPKNTVMLCNK